MKAKHLSENDIQQYVSDSLLCEQSIIHHIESCDVCNEKAVSYRILFSEIEQQAKPAFDFSLADLVLSQLEPSKSKFSGDIFAVYLFAGIGIFAFLLSGILFNKYLSNLFTGTSIFFLYLFAAITLVTILFQGFEIFRRYQKQMNALNIY
jgi:hypothetical protein